jgi:phage tail-like protein
MRRDDWLLGQLPMGMLEDDFFARFVGIFQDVSTTFVDGVDNLENIVDVTVAPEPIVRWLGAWLGIDSIDSSLPHELQRRIVIETGRFLAWRGTRRGLQAFLELVSGGRVEIEETGGVFPEGDAPRRPPTVVMRVQSTGWMPERDFIEMVRDELPAHVRFGLWVGDRQIWPPESVAANTLVAAADAARSVLGQGGDDA